MRMFDEAPGAGGHARAARFEMRAQYISWSELRCHVPVGELACFEHTAARLTVSFNATQFTPYSTAPYAPTGPLVRSMAPFCGYACGGSKIRIHGSDFRDTGCTRALFRMVGRDGS